MDWREAIAGGRIWGLLGTLAIAGVVLLVAIAARAEVGEMKTGTGVICNTVDQVEAVILNKHVDVRRAIAEVNEAIHQEHACGFVTVVYVAGEKLRQASVEAGIYELTEITVLGVLDGSEWHIVTPIKQVTAFFHKARDI